MAKFDISYVIKAIDRFTPVANKIATEAGKMKEKANQVAAGVANKVTPAFKWLDVQVRKTSRSLFNGSKIFSGHMKKAAGWMESMQKKADMFAFKAFIQSMNIIMPIEMIFAKPLEDLSKIQQIMISMRGTFGKTGVAALTKQAESLSKTSLFSVSAIQASQAALANMGGGLSFIKGIMPAIVDYAAKMNMPLGQATQKVAQMVMATKQQNEYMGAGIRISGATEKARSAAFVSQVDKKIGGTALAQTLTATGQLSQAIKGLNKSLEQMLNTASPGLIQLAHELTAVTKRVNVFVKAHPKLISEIAKATAYILAAVSGLVILGAVAAGVTLIFSPFIAAVKGFEAAVTVAKGVAKAWGWAMKEDGIIMKVLSGIMGLVRAAVLAFNIALRANPIGLVITAIGLLIAGIVLLIKHWHKVVAFLKGAVTSAFYALLHPIDAVTNALKGAWDHMKAFFGGKGIEVKTKALAMQQIMMKPPAMTSANMATFGVQTGHPHQVKVDVRLHDPGRAVKSTNVTTNKPQQTDLQLGQNLAIAGAY